MTDSQTEILEALQANSGVTVEMLDETYVMFNAYDSGIEIVVSPHGEIIDGDPVIPDRESLPYL